MARQDARPKEKLDVVLRPCAVRAAAPRAAVVQEHVHGGAVGGLEGCNFVAQVLKYGALVVRAERGFCVWVGHDDALPVPPGDGEHAGCEPLGCVQDKRGLFGPEFARARDKLVVGA